MTKIIQTTWRMAVQGCEVRQTSIDKLCLVGVHHTNHGKLSLHMFMHLVTNGHGMLPRPCPVMHRQSFTTMLLLCAVLCMCLAVPISNTVCFHHAVVKIIMQRSPREFAANAASPASASRRSRLSSTRLCGSDLWSNSCLMPSRHLYNKLCSNLLPATVATLWVSVVMSTGSAAVY